MTPKGTASTCLSAHPLEESLVDNHNLLDSGCGPGCVFFSSDFQLSWQAMLSEDKKKQKLVKRWQTHSLGNKHEIKLPLPAPVAGAQRLSLLTQSDTFAGSWGCFSSSGSFLQHWHWNTRLTIIALPAMTLNPCQWYESIWSAKSGVVGYSGVIELLQCSNAAKKRLNDEKSYLQDKGLQKWQTLWKAVHTRVSRLRWGVWWPECTVSLSTAMQHLPL